MRKNRLAGKTRSLRMDPRNLFYLISALGILLYFLLSLRYGGELYTWMIQENAPEIRFIDYFPHLADAEDRVNLYQHFSSDAGSSYAPLFPPLAYCMYHLLYRLTAVQGGLSVGGSMEATPGALSVFTIYLIFNAVLFFLAIEMTGKRNRRKDLLIFSLLMLSAVFAGSGYLTGNSAMLVLPLLMIGLQWKDSASAFRREMGLLLLAICVGLKIYPAVFGLVFLKEKRYKELLRLILYSLLFLFVPFLFFGGMAGLQAWIGNITAPLQLSDDGRLQYLKGLFFTLIKMISGQEAPMLSTALTILVCLVWVWLAWKSQSKIRTLFFLICVMVFFPSNVFRYTLAYFSIPLVIMLKERSACAENGRSVGIIMALYGLLYTVPVWWLAVIPMSNRFSVYTMTAVEIYLYMVIYLLIIVVMATEFRSFRTHTQRGILCQTDKGE